MIFVDFFNQFPTLQQPPDEFTLVSPCVHIPEAKVNSLDNSSQQKLDEVMWDEVK